MARHRAPIAATPVPADALLSLVSPPPPVSLEDLVPADHFYRHLERTFDW